MTRSWDASPFSKRAGERRTNSSTYLISYFAECYTLPCDKAAGLHARQPTHCHSSRTTTHAKAKPTWVLFVCIGMVTMTVGWLTLSYVGTWWTNQENTWSYGFPRIYQSDVQAFKHDTPVHPTHVIALNLNGKVEVITFPHGDGSHAKMYLGPTIYSDNASLVPVTVTFEDVDGSGRLAMIVHVGNQRIVYPNDGSAFQSPK